MDSVSGSVLKLGFGLEFADLYSRDGLTRLDAAFVAFLRSRAPERAEALLAARTAPEALAHKAEADLLLDIAADFDAFVGDLFGEFVRHAPVRAAPRAQSL